MQPQGRLPDASSSAVAGRSWPTPFRALRHRNYRLLWSGQIVSLVGTWMQNAAQGWLVLVLATNEFGKLNAPFYIGIIGALGSLPMFGLCLFAGVFADRYNRRNILLFTQSALAILALGLGLLVSSGLVRLWHVAIFSMLSGAIMALDMPTRQAFVKDMASPKDLMNAIALNSTIFNLARIFGPAVAGQLIKMHRIGIPGALYLNAASFLAVILGLLLMRVEPTKRHAQTGGLWKHLGEGFRYVSQNRTIRALLTMLAVYSIFGFSYGVLLSVVAVQVLHSDASGYGLLMTATGVGATVGALLLASATERVRKGRILLWGGLLFSLALIAFSFSHHFWLSMLLLAGVGGGLVVSSASINSVIQEIVPDHLRGRVISIWAFIFAGFTPIGSLYAGVAARALSPTTAILVGGLACLVLILAFIARARWIWRLS